MVMTRAMAAAAERAARTAELPREDSYTQYDYDLAEKRLQWAGRNITFEESRKIPDFEPKNLLLVSQGSKVIESCKWLPRKVADQYLLKNLEKTGEACGPMITAAKAGTLFWNSVYYHGSLEKALNDVANKV